MERQLAVLKGLLKETSNAQGQETDMGGITISELERGMVDRASAVALKRKHQMMLLAFLPEMAREDLQNFCDQKGIGFLVIALPDESHDLIIGKYDPHWNSQAHQLIAGQLLSQLEARIDQ